MWCRIESEFLIDTCRRCRLLWIQIFWCQVGRLLAVSGLPLDSDARTVIIYLTPQETFVSSLQLEIWLWLNFNTKLHFFFFFIFIYGKLNLMGVFYMRCLSCCFNKNLSFFSSDKQGGVSLSM